MGVDLIFSVLPFLKHYCSNNRANQIKKKKSIPNCSLPIEIHGYFEAIHVANYQIMPVIYSHEHCRLITFTTKEM